MMSSVGSAMNLCARYIRHSAYNLRGVVSILPTSNLRHTDLSRTYVNELDCSGTLSARSHQGFNARLKGVARELAVVIGILLSIANASDVEASIVPNKALKELANYQLPDNQYKCHNEIVHRESSWNLKAIGNKQGTKQTHGYYQIKSEHIKGKPYDFQFYAYWYYVSSRYSFDKNNPEIPDYCAALHHLKTKGWQ
jgi:hypothetical protein